MINIAIVDDEKHWRDYIQMMTKEYIEKRKIRANIKTYKKMPKVFEHINIVLLDIDLEGDTNGLDIARSLKKFNRDIIIIFITSHNEYALDSYKKDIDGLGYLIKPVDKDELSDKLTQAIIYINGLSLSKMKYIKIGKENVAEKTIISIEIVQRKLYVYTTKGVQEGSYIPLSKLIEELSQAFIMVNRSVIVNMRYIVSYNRGGVWLRDNRIYELPCKKAGDIMNQIMNFQMLCRD